MPSQPDPGAAADRDHGDPTVPPDSARRPDLRRWPTPDRHDPLAGSQLESGGTGPRDFAVLAVTADLGGLDWARTVGLREATGCPELVLSGLPAVLAGAVLESLGERVLRGWRPLPGAVTRVGPLRVRFVAAEDAAGGSPPGPGSVRGGGGDREVVLLVLWADEHGRFPGPVGRSTARPPRRGRDGGEPGHAA